MKKSSMLWSGSWIALLGVALAACGGGGEPSADVAAAVAADDRTRVAVGATAVTPALLNDDGSAAAGAASAPADAGAHTRSGRYATPAQARQLADALGQDAIEIEVGCCGAEAVELAVGTAWGLQAAHDLPAGVPVLVRGQDLRLAAATANRLAEGGLTHVWLVSP